MIEFLPPTYIVWREGNIFSLLFIHQRGWGTPKPVTQEDLLDCLIIIRS